MRLRILAATGLLAFVLALRAVAQTPIDAASAVDPCIEEFSGCGKACLLHKRFAAGLPPSDAYDGVIEREPLGATDVLHNNLDIEIFPSTERITGSNTMTVRSLADGLAEFTIRLRSNYTITAAMLNDVTPVPPASITATGSYGRRVPLDRVYNQDETFTLRIEYTGIAVSRGFGSIEFGTTSAGNPIVATLSEPYFAATWWPCKDGDFAEPGDNADKATLEFAITAPANLKSVANGVLLGFDDLSGSRRRYRYASNYPISTYLVAFSSTVYNSWTDVYAHPGGSMPLEYHVYPNSDTANNRAVWNLTPAMLDAFAPVYGYYPFINEKYTTYQFPFSGGMEHQTATGMGVFNESVTAHELAHQWWGDNVTCRTWHDIWLNEGFASYGEAIWLERKPGSSGIPALHAAMAARRPSDVSGSVWCPDVTSMNRIFSSNWTYRKGGWVLHMLRKVVGDDTFFQILSVYRATFEGSAATTDDFIAVASAVAGRDLGWFFSKWVYGIGAPAYDYGWQPAVINGQAYLRLYVRQRQDTDYGMFTMPIDVRVDTADSSETHTVWNDALTEHFVIPVSAAPTGATLDEFNWILATGKSIVAYVNGPPKIVQTVPAPGAAIAADAAPDSVAITFSENATTNAAHYVVTGPSGVVPATFAYSAANLTTTLSFHDPLEPGEYTLTVSEQVRSAVANIQLDGELADTASPASLPSGNGQPGGAATISFRVRPPCPLDLNGDDAVGLSDLAVVLGHFGLSGMTAAQGDFNADENVDLSDLAILLASFGTDCP